MFTLGALDWQALLSHNANREKKRNGNKNPWKSIELHILQSSTLHQFLHIFAAVYILYTADVMC